MIKTRSKLNSDLAYSGDLTCNIAYEGNLSCDVSMGKGDKGDSFTYEDFTPEQLESLKGEDGKSVEFNKSDTHLQYRVIGELDWIDLVPLIDLKGEKGDTGLDEEAMSLISSQFQNLINKTNVLEMEVSKNESTIELINDKVSSKVDGDYVSNKIEEAIANLVDNAPESLNTLKELADALISHENEYDALLQVVGGKVNRDDVYTKVEVNEIKLNLKALISKVEDDYKAADVVLDERLKLIENVTGGTSNTYPELDKIKEDISFNANEIAECKTSISANTSVITKEIDDRVQADNTLDEKITIEKERALVVEGELDGKINTVTQELTVVKEDVSVNADSILQEVSNRQSAINLLDKKINNVLPVVDSVQPSDRDEGHIWIEILD